MSSITPNMTLTIPTVGNAAVPDGGPGYATEINAAINLIDAHDHSSGKGLPVTQNGINITGALPFQTNPATGLTYIGLTNQTAALSTTRTLYNVNGELYWTDGSGNQVAITAAGAVNTGATGNLSGMDGSAAVTYSAITKTFTFTQSAAFPAKVAHGDLLLYETVAAAAQTITIKAPAGLANTFTLTLPGALPATNALTQFSTAGVISFIAAPANTGLLQSTSAGVTTFVSTLPNTLLLPSATALTDSAGNFLAGGVKIGPASLPTGTIGYGPIGSNLQVFTAPPPTLVQGAGTVSSGVAGALLLTFAAAHGLREGEVFQASSTVTLPGNISASTSYLVHITASNTINLYAVPANWLYTVPLITAASPAGLTFGALIAYSSTGSGTLRVTPGYIPPSSVTRVRARGVGGGSGGNGGETGGADASTGGGGGAGAYSEGFFIITPGTFYPIVIGAGGAGGPTSTIGSVGSVTTFLGASVAGGAITGGFYFAGNPGGAAGSGGIVNIAGGDGGPGTVSSTEVLTGSLGGSSRYGGGGTGTYTGSYGAHAGQAPGSGGAGGPPNVAGAAGANGLVEIEW